jgi:hypothetical protein
MVKLDKCNSKCWCKPKIIMNEYNRDYIFDMVSNMSKMKWNNVDHFFIKELEFMVNNSG